ncbi:MAG: ArnT family glycosyltransferase, partial [Prochlorothrix sp.]
MGEASRLGPNPVVAYSEGMNFQPIDPMAPLPNLPQPTATDQRWFWGLTLAAVVLWLIGLGGMPLRDWDEGTYGLLAREMVRSRDWLHLSLFGQPFWLKPPLAIWAMALGYGIGGGDGLGSPWLEFSLRFPLALISALGVPLLYCVGRDLFRHQRQALYPALVYLTLLSVVRHGRLAMLDGIVNTGMILLFLCILKARKRPPWAIGIGLCLGAIALTKGILVLAIGAMAGLYILLAQHWSLLRNPYTWLGLVLGGTLTGAWYWLQYQTYGSDFLIVHFGAQGFDRLATSVEGNDGPVWYYLLEILKYNWPWLVFFPVGLKQAGQQWQSWGLFALLGFWIFLTVVSGMGTKLPWYLFPCYPFLAVIVGGYFATGPRPGRGYGYFFAVLTVATTGGGIYLGATDPQLPLLIT